MFVEYRLFFCLPVIFIAFVHQECSPASSSDGNSDIWYHLFETPAEVSENSAPACTQITAVFHSPCSGDIAFASDSEMLPKTNPKLTADAECRSGGVIAHLRDCTEQVAAAQHHTSSVSVEDLSGRGLGLGFSRDNRRVLCLFPGLSS